LAQHKGLVAFLHIDCDLYASTSDVLAGLGDRLVPGSVIVFDEFFNYPGWQDGEYKAFKEFLDERGVGARYLAYNKLHEQVSCILE
jgi:hypothetical protein